MRINLIRVTSNKLNLPLEVDQINSYLSDLRNHSPYDDEINDLIDQILQNGGKRIRPLICLLSFEMISNEQRNDTSLAAACSLEVIHNASLIIDDIFDKDIYRRQEKSFYLKYSTFAALSISYSLSSLALSLASKTNVIEIVDELIKAIHTLSTSLFLEQKFRSGKNKMTQEEALQLIDRKTSSLFEAASVIGVLLGNSSKEDRESMKLFGKLFGRAFQLKDDYFSLTSEQNDLGKSGVWTDISNRIQTYIVLEAMDLVSPSEKEILDDYYIDTKDFPTEKIKSILVNSGALEIVKNQISQYISEAIAILNMFSKSPSRDKLIQTTNLLQI